MRKVKAYQLLAAAVAAVPGVVFASGDETLPLPRPAVTPAQHTPGMMTAPFFRGGDFSLANTDSNGTFTWIGAPDVLHWKPVQPTFSVNNGATWNDPTNWTPAGGPPDGATAIANIGNENGGNTIRVTSNITLSRINFSDQQFAVLAAPLPVGATPVITMTGESRIDTLNEPPTGPNAIFFGNQFGLPADTTAGNPARPVQIGGTSGLNVTSGPIAFNNDNVYSGNTTISGGGLVVIQPTATFDGVFGNNAANSVILDNGRIFINADTQTATRNIAVNAGGGTIFLGSDTAVPNHMFSGVISGAGNLTIDGNFSPANATITGNNTISGNVTWSPALGNFTAGGSGSLTITGSNGGFASAANFINNGTVVLIRGNSDADANRFNNSGTVIMNGGAIRMENNNSSPMLESIGTTVLNKGTSAIIMRPVSGFAQLNLGNVTRQTGAGLEVRGAISARAQPRFPRKC